MNWVGGARYRNRYWNARQEEKRQREYFERKRLSNQVKRLEVERSSVQKGRKKHISRDLLHLQCVKRTKRSPYHYGKERGPSQVRPVPSNAERQRGNRPVSRPITHLNLQNGQRSFSFRPRPGGSRRHRRNVYLPNMSPCEEPSKIEIMDATDDEKPDVRCSRYFKHRPSHQSTPRYDAIQQPVQMSHHSVRGLLPVGPGLCICSYSMRPSARHTQRENGFPPRKQGFKEAVGHLSMLSPVDEAINNVVESSFEWNRTLRHEKPQPDIVVKADITDPSSRNEHDVTSSGKRVNFSHVNEYFSISDDDGSTPSSDYGKSFYSLMNARGSQSTSSSAPSYSRHSPWPADPPEMFCLSTSGFCNSGTKPEWIHSSTSDGPSFHCAQRTPHPFRETSHDARDFDEDDEPFKSTIESPQWRPNFLFAASRGDTKEGPGGREEQSYALPISSYRSPADIFADFHMQEPSNEAELVHAWRESFDALMNGKIHDGPPTDQGAPTQWDLGIDCGQKREEGIFIPIHMPEATKQGDRIQDEYPETSHIARTRQPRAPAPPSANLTEWITSTRKVGPCVTNICHIAPCDTNREHVVRDFINTSTANPKRSGLYATNMSQIAPSDTSREQVMSSFINTLTAGPGRPGPYVTNVSGSVPSDTNLEQIASNTIDTLVTKNGQYGLRVTNASGFVPNAQEMEKLSSDSRYNSPVNRDNDTAVCVRDVTNPPGAPCVTSTVISSYFNPSSTALTERPVDVTPGVPSAANCSLSDDKSRDEHHVTTRKLPKIADAGLDPQASRNFTETPRQRERSRGKTELPYALATDAQRQKDKLPESAGSRRKRVLDCGTSGQILVSSRNCDIEKKEEINSKTAVQDDQTNISTCDESSEDLFPWFINKVDGLPLPLAFLEQQHRLNPDISDAELLGECSNNGTQPSPHLPLPLALMEKQYRKNPDEIDAEGLGECSNNGTKPSPHLTPSLALMEQKSRENPDEIDANNVTQPLSKNLDSETENELFVANGSRAVGTSDTMQYAFVRYEGTNNVAQPVLRRQDTKNGVFEADLNPRVAASDTMPKLATDTKHEYPVVFNEATPVEGPLSRSADFAELKISESSHHRSECSMQTRPETTFRPGERGQLAMAAASRPSEDAEVEMDVSVAESPVAPLMGRAAALRFNEHTEIKMKLASAKSGKVAPFASGEVVPLRSNEHAGLEMIRAPKSAENGGDTDISAGKKANGKSNPYSRILENNLTIGGGVANDSVLESIESAGKPLDAPLSRATELSASAPNDKPLSPSPRQRNPNQTEDSHLIVSNVLEARNIAKTGVCEPHPRQISVALSPIIWPNPEGKAKSTQTDLKSAPFTNTGVQTDFASSEKLLFDLKTRFPIVQLEKDIQLRSTAPSSGRQEFVTPFVSPKRPETIGQRLSRKRSSRNHKN